MSIDFVALRERQEDMTRRETHEEREKKEKIGWRERRRLQREEAEKYGALEHHPHLLAIKPQRGMMYHSDYFDVDDGVATIVGLFQDQSADGAFAPFWGINKVPHGLPDGVSVAILEQARVRPQKWIDDKMKTTERLEAFAEGDMQSESSKSAHRAVSKVAGDTEVIIEELAQGSSYIHVHYRLMVKAPSLAVLDDAMETIRLQYVNNFGVLELASYPGEQRQEHTKLFMSNDVKRGKGFDFTSKELAGSYSFVTNGINDPQGEYLGQMANDVNTSGVVFDVNRYKTHVVVADNNYARSESMHSQQIGDLWGSKISQSALLNNARVVHIILNGANLDLLGPKFEKISTNLDMGVGDINMLAMFGDPKDELSIFPAHIEKLSLMVEQLTKKLEHAAITDGYLREELVKFYIDKGMWSENADENRERLRIVDIPHEDVPRLQDLVSYFETGYATAKREFDTTTTNAYNTLRMLFRDMLSTNGSLFNTYTNPRIEAATLARRVVYDFSSLKLRGHHIAMAQLVNVIGYAVAALGRGDTLIIHGAEEIDDSVKKYLTDQIQMLRKRRGRVAYIYGDISAMLRNQDFNGFDRADYTILGPMSPSVAKDYQATLAQELSPELERAITKTDENRAYIRRGYENVVFNIEMPLGLGSAKSEDFIPPKPGEKGYVKPIDEIIAERLKAREHENAPEKAQHVAPETQETHVSLAQEDQTVPMTQNVSLRRNARTAQKRKQLKKR